MFSFLCYVFVCVCARVFGLHCLYHMLLSVQLPTIDTMYITIHRAQQSIGAKVRVYSVREPKGGRGLGVHLEWPTVT